MTLRVLLNGSAVGLALGATVPEALAALGSDGSGVAVAVNGVVVPRRAWAATPLGAGDEVEVVTAVQGG